MQVRTGDQAFIKRLNKAIILQTLRRHAPVSRAGIARLTGLNKATVSVLVDELVAEHLAVEVGTGESSGGRRPRLLVLNDRAGLVAGVDLGVDYILVVIQDLLGRPLWRQRVAHPDGSRPEAVLARIAALIREGAAQFPGTPLGLRGIGVGIPGLVEHQRGLLLYAPNLGWQDVAVRDWLARQFDLPVQVENEANAGAVGEHWSGAGMGVQDLVFFSVGIGLGTGVIIRDELFRGHGGVAGELGHTTVEAQGPVCACGNRGCLEVMASEAALRRQVARLLPGQPLLDGRPVERLEVAEIARAADQGNPAAIAALGTVGRQLGIGVANAINIFNPQLVVIGGPLALGGAYILNPVRQVVAERALAHPRRQARTALSALGAEACAVGAGALVLRELFRLPQVVA